MGARQTRILLAVKEERDRQDEIFGQQHLPDGTARPMDSTFMREAKAACDERFRQGHGSWRLVLNEEVSEAYAAPTLGELREELIQVAAVAVAWVEDIDSRGSA